MHEHSESQEPNLGKYAVDKSIEKRRAAQFQAGHNPMSMSGFERQAAMKEAMERWEAKNKYIAGIQGTDGGCY